jgi:hypothetical protein
MIVSVLQPGDGSHVSKDDLLREIIEEEKDKDSFTTVVVSGINPDHIPYLKGHFTTWTTQLAYVCTFLLLLSPKCYSFFCRHIYHYYLHGPNGNVEMETDRSKYFKNIDITVSLVEVELMA